MSTNSQTIIIIVIAIWLALQSVLLAVVLLRGRRDSTAEAAKAAAEKQAPPTPTLTPEQMNKLEQDAQTAFEGAVQTATQQFGGDLGVTSKRLNALIVKLTTDVVEGELEQYRSSLAKARTDALTSMASMQTAIDQHREGLLADVDAELDKRRSYLMERLDQRLGAAVAAYIVESLGQGADLGAQRAFLLENLERHKKELQEEVVNGNPT